VMVEGYAMGRSPDELCAEMLRVLGEQATTKLAGEAPRLRLIGDRDTSALSSPDGETSS
jgi:hypothetical protein